MHSQRRNIRDVVQYLLKCNKMTPRLSYHASQSDRQPYILSFILLSGKFLSPSFSLALSLFSFFLCISALLPQLFLFFPFPSVLRQRYLYFTLSVLFSFFKTVEVSPFFQYVVYAHHVSCRARPLGQTIENIPLKKHIYCRVFFFFFTF